MNKFETFAERIFKDRVKVNTSDLQYVEKGIDFVRFRDPETGKLFEVRVKEKVNRQKLK